MAKLLRMGAAVAAASLAMGLLASSPAFADEPYPDASPGQLTAIEEAGDFLTEYGVDQATQDALFDKFLAGESWDSFTSASTPVRVEESVEDGYDVTVSYYSDGSVSVSRLEIPVARASSGDISTMSEPNGCTIGSGGARTNCNVDTWVGLISMGFKANYNVSSNTVSSVWGASWTIGGSCSSSLSYLGRPNSNTGLETVSAQMCGVPYATAFNLQVQVSGGTATESWW